MTRAAVLVSLSLMTTVVAAQDTLFVTERLFLGLYEEPGNGGERLMLIPSGDEVTVLVREGEYARVRAGDGTEGWVRFNVLTAEPPAVTRIPGLETRIAELETALEAERAAAAEAATADDGPPAEVDTAAREALAAAEQRASELAGQLAQAHVAVEQAGEIDFRELWPWLAGLSVIALLAGFTAGWWLLDRRVRQQHGGFRTW